MLRQVWIDDWQMQCCGDHFRVGQRVEFSTMTAEVDREFLGGVLGEQRAAALTDDVRFVGYVVTLQTE